MAKKNDKPITGDDSPAPLAAVPDLGLLARHDELRADRRKLETELAEINGKIRSAIETGDIGMLNSLSARRAELPALFIAASVAETAARHEIFNAEDDANVKTLRDAESERDELQSALATARAESEAKLAALKEATSEAEGRVGAMYAAITASRDRGAIADAGFKKSLAALTGI